MGQLIGLVSAEPQVDADAIAAVLDAEDETEPDEVELDINTDAEKDGVSCQHRVGVIAELFDTHGYISNPEDITNKLYFQRKDGLEALKVGDQVVYLAFKTSEFSNWVVKRILYIENESWDNKNAEEETDLDKTVVKEECETAYKHVIAKVTGREGRTVLAGNLQFCIDSVHVDFLPVEGDWLVLQSLVQTEEVADTLLVIERVTPLRSQQRDGRVSHWNGDTGQGIMDSEVVFGKDACEPGYLPRVGDEVRVYCIESEQGQLTWRALRVVPTAERETEISHDPQALATLLQDKQGITISEDTNFGIVNIGRESQRTIEIKNESESPQKLLRVEMTSTDSQFHLIQPLVNPKDIYPHESVQFAFKVKGRFVGRSTEVVVFKFEEFDIGRLLAVDVQSATLSASLSDVRGRSTQQRNRYEPITAQKLLATRNGFIMPGVKPLKPANFVPVSLGMFVIPEKLVNLALGSEPSKLEELVIRLVDGYKCLGEPLTLANYVARWDLLIHLEEVEHAVNIARYNTHASLRRVQDYLSLEILGLAERRPSLVIGDKVIARQAWNDDKSWATNGKEIGYEGYIHKVLSNEILIKFSPSFHDTCHGVYSISFEANRTSFRRQHQAVHLAIRNFCGDWLFPTRISYKPPQITIVGEEDHINSACLPKSVNSVKELDEVKIDDAKSVEENCEVNTVSIKPDLLENRLEEQNNILNAETTKSIMNLDDPVIAEVKTDLSDSSKNSDDILNSVDNMDINKSIDTVLNNTAHNINKNSNNKSTSNGQPIGKRVKTKVSDMFEKTVPKNEIQQKVSPPRIPVVARFLQNGNNPCEKSPKEVKNMLQQLANLSTNDRLPMKNQDMKTLEEIEKSILNNATNIFDGIKPLPGKKEEMAPEKQENSSSDSINLNIPNVNSTDKQTSILPVQENQFKSSFKSESNKKIVKKKSGKASKNDINKTVKAVKKEDQIEWNSNMELKIGNVKEAEDKISRSKSERIIKWFNPALNNYQKEAVRNILQGKARPLPYVIFGPPGTGKTITLVEVILQLYFLIPESRLLIGTPSNSAADLICERLLDWDLLAPGDMLRLVGYRYAEMGRISERLRPYCGNADIKARDDFQEYRHLENVVNISRHAIGRHRITVGTCNTLGVLYQLGFPRGHFTHVLVDEAGQATEPEIMIPLAFLHSSYGQAVFAGDPLQLGPVVLSRTAEQLGLGESLLSRLLLHTPYCRDFTGHPSSGGYNPHLLTRLVYNYRSLPEILQLSNNMFYDGDLLPQVDEEKSEEARVLVSLRSVLPPRPDSSPPALVFHGVRGTNCQAVDSPSWHNPHEAVQVTMYLQALYAAGLTPEQCGIITPYQAQAVKIRQMLDTLEVSAPKVGSVEEFQGQERMAIIVSTVRSSPQLIQKDLRHTIGFVASPRRLNVAVTRARALLVVIGNPHLLARDHYWRTVLTYCVRNQAYTGCDLPDLGI
ncbi:LOW QUALITY PROTEIN: probable RNA helicase armi [Homalodisca vitripennis]|uniref:LOW QUALITY PROTEIN: probable RNA helicase armi n=1 Tax=Homalodisca vitripennis TaxID=197043 RepID=UPI001EEBCFC1|nr:LOW QUALITY PROTEIN: probable RNA helicase armi [Homalodisca vitripennis]